jgi:dUTP pyrophosphatase
MEVKIKKLNEMAQVPRYAKKSDAGMDLVAISKEETADYIEYGTGLAMEIPQGYVGLIFPRSSISNTELVLANSVGVIDSGYRGEVKARFKKTGHDTVFSHDVIKFGTEYDISDKVAQIIILPYPKIEFEEVEELNESARGANGFGSSGR